jgi:hypothetical protein
VIAVEDIFGIHQGAGAAPSLALSDLLKQLNGYGKFQGVTAKRDLSNPVTLRDANFRRNQKVAVHFAAIATEENIYPSLIAHLFPIHLSHIR